MSPGDRIQVEFPSPESVDEVVIECEEAAGARPQIEVLEPGGRWIPVTDTVQVSKSEPPEGIRRAATRDLKALGFRYILLNEGDLVYEDVARNGPFWGMTELAKGNGTHFYRID